MSDAADKLALSRLAIVDHLQRREHRGKGREEAADGEQGDYGDDAWARPEPGAGAGAWFSSFKHAATSWWRRHPASLGLELATPMLSQYARRKPAQFLGIAAGLGVVFMVVRPWRLISLTGLVVALAKSSQLSGVIMSAMSAADYQKDHQRYR